MVIRLAFTCMKMGVTVTDNGRGIPVQALPNSNIPVVQSVLTDVHRLNTSAHFLAPARRGHQHRSSQCPLQASDR